MQSLKMIIFLEHREYLHRKYCFNVTKAFVVYTTGVYDDEVQSLPKNRLCCAGNSGTNKVTLEILFYV